jgi:light-regulated signal transduction histidine kinase (bacteriophytochrome)
MSTNPRSFRDKLSNIGLTFWVVVIVASILLVGANIMYAGTLVGRENNARALTSDLQVLSQQLAKYTQEAVDGNAEAFAEFKATKARIESIVNALRTGSTTDDVVGYEGSTNAPAVSAALEKVTQTWAPMSEAAARIEASEEDVLNLADTAAQFTGRGGIVTLVVARHSNEAIVAVRDNGMGIDRGELPHVFEVFSQRQPVKRGLGIGLALVKTLVELHGGRVAARSEGIGKGSEFVVSLPALEAKPQLQERLAA